MKVQLSFSFVKNNLSGADLLHHTPYSLELSWMMNSSCRVGTMEDIKKYLINGWLTESKGSHGSVIG
jgi:hypothetical protein